MTGINLVRELGGSREILTSEDITSRLLSAMLDSDYYNPEMAEQISDLTVCELRRMHQGNGEPEATPDEVDGLIIKYISTIIDSHDRHHLATIFEKNYAFGSSDEFS